MNRRQLLKGLTIAAAGIPLKTLAYQQCNNYGVCEVGISMPRLQQTYADQKMSQWCWAASIQMIFSYYGYYVSQAEIVLQAYGSIQNIPALSGRVISQALARRWTDENGRQFRVRLRAAYDADAGVHAINNQLILQSLARELPLVFCNLSHAMVLTAASFQNTPMGPQIFNLGFMDPWPGNGIRGLNDPLELQTMHTGGHLRYLALPIITPA
ncbi:MULTISPECIES: papain-like cysteine protease family protein [unclassified Pseudomonas]|uniref:papain-like cysteine protease family protein n=1 Tax=unclassified Pseudomonas TaxID=196821 RepID=UPI0011AEFB65|nr:MULTISPECIES: papain-like cysteine protease family protein [unclassified Pseudomonas]